MQDIKKLKVGSITFDALSFAVGYEAGRQKKTKGISSDFIVEYADNREADPTHEDGNTASDGKGLHN